MNMPRLMGRAAAAGRLPDPCGIADIAARFGHSADWFQRRWPELVTKHGFPAPLPLTRRKWAAAPVEAWFDAMADRVRNAPTITLHGPPTPTADELAADFDAILDRRAIDIANRDHA